MSQTDNTTTPAKGVPHKHGLSATDAAILDLQNRVTALEAGTQPPPAGGYDVPPAGTPVFTGDKTGATDCSVAFAAFLNANAGKAISFAPGATYRMDQATQVSNLDGWDLYGQGATVKCNVLGSGTQAWVRAVTSDNWRIRDVKLVGPASHQDVVDNWRNYGWAREDWRGIIIDGGHNVELRRVKVNGFWGDCLYIARRDNSADQYATPDGVTLSDCDFWDAGRNVVSLVAGKNISVTNCRIGNAGLCAWDTEPNLATDVTTGVTFSGCRFYGGDLGRTQSASHDSHGNGYVIYVSAGAAQADHYTMQQCTLDVGAIYVRRPSAPWNSYISITNCTADVLGDATFDVGDTNVTFSNNTNINRVNV